MHTFFHGWRRKAGLVSLVIACVLMGIWVRSRVVCDAVEVSRGGRGHFIASMQSGVVWCARDSDAQADWRIGSRSLADARVGDMPLAKIVEQLLNADHNQQVNLTVWTIPYWLLTIPTVVLSAYLILWKPRKQPAHA